MSKKKNKEHDEAVQAYKEGKIDTGINLSNGKWTICGVFKGKLSFTDLPTLDVENKDIKQPRCCEEGDCDYEDCRGCEQYNECYDNEANRRLGKNGFCAAPGATYDVDECAGCPNYNGCSEAEKFCEAEKCPQCGNSLEQCAECGCEEEECPRTGTNQCAKFDKNKCAECPHYEICDDEGVRRM